MGDYLKQQYEERELAKALAKVHGIIDEETKKLSDKYHDLELSHKRQEKLLKRTLDYLDSLGFVSDNGDYYPLHDAIDAELKNPLYRCREKKKGGV